MKRREFVKQATRLGATAIVLRPDHLYAGESGSQSATPTRAEVAQKLQPPARGPINVAFVLTEAATVIDFAGPWEVFQDVHIEERGSTMQEQMPFRLYTVSDKTELLTASGGMKIMPDFTFDAAPPPKIVVVPAQRGRSKRMLDWLREATKTADVIMSVCTGAFVLGAAGLLSGKRATTHHAYQDTFAKRFPDVNLQRGRRFVENEKISTAGGLTSGIDLALRVVERYFGRQIAQGVADYMEYQSKGWMP